MNKFALLVALTALCCSSPNPSPPTDASPPSDTITVVPDSGCYGPAGTYELTFELQESSCDAKYAHGKMFKEKNGILRSQVWKA